MTTAKPSRATRRGITRVLEAIRCERYRQVAKWGDDCAKDHPDGTGPRTVHTFGLDYAENVERQAKWRTDRHAGMGRLTWADILTEEWAEAMAADNPADLEAELVQVAAVATKWVEALRRRAER